MNKNTTDIRQTFLDFFQSKGHKLLSSSSLIPNNDPTLLFTNAGMNQFKDVFLKQCEQNYYSRVTTSQRCVRAGGKHNDLENVGYTNRHHTFFEMLGNFSFGDYFKKEAITFAWELLTSSKWFDIPKEKLWITVYETDDESYSIWEKEIGIPKERIIRIGDTKNGKYSSDNFWQMGDTGPCGPCTEIFFDHGKNIYGGPPGSTEETGDRYVEIWNIVFIQFNRQSDGSMLMLPQPSVDTGMGLERISAVLQQVTSNYEIDLFVNLIKSVAQVTEVSDLHNKSLRVIADHIRSCAFLIADGIIPSNESRGYVLRRIIRRALRHGNILGTKETFFYRLVAPLIDVMGTVGDALRPQKAHIEHILKIEEEQFAKTLKRGLVHLNEALTNLETDTLDGKTVFRLSDTFGFPVDMTEDICRERNLKIDKAAFEQEMQYQRLRARKFSEFSINYTNKFSSNNISLFKGYENLEWHANVIEIFTSGKKVEHLSENEEGIIILNETPFYGESGGQIGDTGKLIKKNDMHFVVSDTKRYTNTIGHIGKLTKGNLHINDSVIAIVDKVRHNRICLNHSATHLLHTALRQILGFHVMQKGSLVKDEYMRFDFSHFEAIKPQDIYQIEKIVNLKIRDNLLVKTNIMNLEEAIDCGAIALFDEKYNNRVRVVSIGDFSIELCGGTHVARTGDIGLFHILSESSIASGIRRIEAVTGAGALDHIYYKNKELLDIAYLMKTNISNVKNKVHTLIQYNGELKKELKEIKDELIKQQCILLLNQSIVLKNTKLLVNEIKNVNIKPNMLTTIVNYLKTQLNSAVIVLAIMVNTKKVSVIIAVTKDLTDRIKANELLDDILKHIGGKGGGHSNIAQAVGSNNLNALSSILNSMKLRIIKKI